MMGFFSAESFETALFDVSLLIDEAQRCERCKRGAQATAFYALAETYALGTGFVELVQLVWAYAPPPASLGRSATFGPNAA